MYFDVPLYLLPLCRFFSFFYLSPAFCRLPFPFFAKGALTLSLTLFAAFAAPSSYSSLWVGIPLELTLGYLLGTLCAFIFESVGLAANFLGNMGGLGLSALLTGQERDTLPSPLLMGAFVLFFSLDLHHLLIHHLFDLPLTPTLYSNLIFSFSDVLKGGVMLLTAPLFILAATGLFLTFLSKLFPCFPLFWTLLPLQIFLGLFCLLLTFSKLSFTLWNSYEHFFKP
jgi:flagellar biosynthesis protein FliR